MSTSQRKVVEREQAGRRGWRARSQASQRRWERLGKATGKNNLFIVRKHYYATGHEYNQNHSKTRNPNRPDQEPTPTSGADASGESFPSIQCVWQTGLPVQRSPASAPTRPLLPAQLRLSREKDLQVHPHRNPRPGADRTGQLQKIPTADRSVDRPSP